MDEDHETPERRLVGAAITTLTLLVAFTLLFAGVGYWWVAFPVGFGGLLPLSIALLRYREERTAGPHGSELGRRSDALDELRDRYARGEMDDEEFERRVERLLETETDADATAFAERSRRTRERSDEAETTERR